MPKLPGGKSLAQRHLKELERLSGHDVVLKKMRQKGMSMDRETYARMAGLDPDNVGAEQEADFPSPFRKKGR